MSFRPVELFGGSIVADLPATYTDVSNIREVPDHQEVYLDPDGFTSIVVEILERVDKSDVEALTYHLDDLVETDAAETKVISTAEAYLSKMPAGTPAYTLIAIAPPEAQKRGRANEPDFTAIYLTLIRLVKEETDLLVAVNVPFIKGKYDQSSIDSAAGRFGPLGEHAQRAREKILQSLEIKDWSLFGGN